MRNDCPGCRQLAEALVMVWDHFSVDEDGKLEFNLDGAEEALTAMERALDRHFDFERWQCTACGERWPTDQSTCGNCCGG